MLRRPGHPAQRTSQPWLGRPLKRLCGPGHGRPLPLRLGHPLLALRLDHPLLPLRPGHPLLALRLGLALRPGHLLPLRSAEPGPGHPLGAVRLRYTEPAAGQRYLQQQTTGWLQLTARKHWQFL